MHEALIVDFTDPGCKLSCSKLWAIGEASSRLAATQKRSCAIVVAPNLGDGSGEDSSEGMLKAQSEVEGEMPDSERDTSRSSVRLTSSHSQP